MKILFAIDLLEPPSVTKAVEELAERFQAELLVLHVYLPTPAANMPIDPMTGFGDMAYALYDPEVEHTIELAEEHEFHSFVVERFNRQVRPALLKGDPARTILEEADKLSADLIVLGKRHHGRLERLLLGSVASYVTEHAERPVLLMPILKKDADA